MKPRRAGALATLLVLAAAGVGCGDDAGDGGAGGDGERSTAAFCEQAAELGDVGSAFDSADGEAIGDLFTRLGDAADAAPEELAEEIEVLRDVSGRLAEALEETDDPRRLAEVQAALAEVDPADVSAALQVLQQAMQEDCGITPGQ